MGDLSQKYAHLAEQVARELLGTPRNIESNEWRYGTKGSLCIHVRGPRQGRFKDHENGDEGDLIDLVMRERGCSRQEAMEWLDSLAGNNSPSTSKTAPVARSAAKSGTSGPMRWSTEAETIWDRAQMLPRTPGQAYLEHRKCYFDGIQDVRYLAPYKNYGHQLVARVTDFVTGQPLTLQFRAFDPNSYERENWRFLGRHVTKHGVVRLVPLDSDLSVPLGLAEGIETALSVMSYERRGLVTFKAGPVWAALSAGNLKNLPHPPSLGNINIWADSGVAGQDAASSLAQRWMEEQSSEARIMTPEGVSDWNDDLQRELAA